MICLGILLVIALINLRGARETGIAFMIPTYLFLATLLTVIVLGVLKSLAAGGHPMPVQPPPPLASGNGNARRVDASESFLQRMHRDDGRRGGE